MHKVILIFTLLFTFWLTKSSMCYALSPSWELVYPSINESTYISSSASNPLIVYASIRKTSDFDVLKSLNSGQNWFSIKNNLPTAADVNWISIFNQNSDVLAISVWGNNGGIFLSENGGTSWLKIFSSTTPRSVAIHPTDFTTIYIGIGGSNSGDSGVYKTTDKGLNWHKIPELDTKNNAQISINPSNPDFILADSDPFFYRSLNSGLNWTQLSIQNTYSTGTIFDNKNGKIFTGNYGTNKGVYVSINNGDSWIPKNTGFDGYPFHISQNINGDLYVTNGSGYTGKVWHSGDGAETWENIGDPSWGIRNTWGLDVSANRILVSVEGLGIYYADLNPAPDPVVFIPGFLGSWSYKGLIENQPTTYSDWELIPIFTDNYYQPLLSTLKNAGLTENQNLFTFGYDYRKSISDSANSLNAFLGNKLPDQKANIVAHSMGGLVARYCFEKVSGCADKIGKIITAGTPHKGLIQAYQLWEGGELDKDPLMKFVEEIALHSTNLPYLSNKDIIQNRFPGVKDLLPTPLISNPLLESLSNTPTITTLSGNSLPTYENFSTTPRSAMDKALGLWIDGKPNIYSTGIGDGTVLKTSSDILGFDYSVEHKDYFRTTNSLTDIMTALNLTPSSLVTENSSVNSVLAFIIHSSATITVNGKTGSAIFIQNPTTQNYEVTITGTGNGNFQLDSVFADKDRLVKKSITNTISLNQTKTFNFNFVPDSSQKFVNNQDNVLLYSFNSLVAASKNRTVKSIGALVNKGVLEKSYIDLINLLKVENKALERKNIEDIANQLLVYVVDKNKTVITQSVALSEKGRALKSINVKLAKSSLITREAVNLSMAQAMKTTADDLLSAGNYYQSILLYRGINYLLN